MTLYAWIAAVVSNVVDEFSEMLPGFRRAHLRMLRRWFLAEPTELYLSQGTLIVFLRPQRLKQLWLTLIEAANARSTRIPWLDDRRLILSMEPPISEWDQPANNGSHFYPRKASRP